MEGVAYIIGGLIVIGLLVWGFVLIWNILMTTLYFGLVWFPPVILCILLIGFSNFLSWSVYRIYKRQGQKTWTISPTDIRAVWRSSLYPWIIAPILAFTLTLWVTIVPWQNLWPENLELPLIFNVSINWGKASIRNMFLSRSTYWFIYIGYPLVLAVFGLRRIMEWFFVRRVVQIDAQVRGTDINTECLREKDKQIQKAYLMLGVMRNGNHEASFRTWVSSSIHLIIRDNATAIAQYQLNNKQADDELTSVTKCVDHFNAVKVILNTGITLQSRNPSKTLLLVVEEVGSLLDSKVFGDLVEAQLWQDIDVFLKDVSDGLSANIKLAEEWARSIPNTDTVQSRAEMTFEAALVLVGLRSSYTKKELEKRRRELNSIYHPDRMDEKHRGEADTKMAFLNQALDLLETNLKEQNV